MRHWRRRDLIGMRGGHIASGPRARIQVLGIQREKAPLWDLGEGHLLLICLEGELVVETSESMATLVFRVTRSC